MSNASDSQLPQGSGPASWLKALGPIAVGLILDFVDLTTFGPIGIRWGWLIGGGVAWILASLNGFSPRTRWILAVLAALYASLPGTEIMPIATAIGVLARLRR